MPEHCCEPFGQLVSQEEYCPTFHLDAEARWAFGGDNVVMRFCPFCGTPAPQPWFDENEIASVNADLHRNGANFVYLTREQTNHILSYAARDNPKRDTPDGRWSCYRVAIDGKWYWRDQTTLYGDVREMTTVHNQMSGPNYGARLTDDALYVITKREPEP